MRFSSFRGRRHVLSLLFSSIIMLLLAASSWLALPSDCQGNETEGQFIERWKTFDETIQVLTLGPPGFRRRIEMPYNSLRQFKGQVMIPPDKENAGQVLVLSAQQDRAVLLATPPDRLDSAEFLGEEFRQKLASCATDHSWIVALPENSWTEVDLNPYCTMAYDESGIVVDLYWTRSSSRPLIDISTNGFSCVSHRLYGWDGKTSAYRLQAQKCTGSRPAENYSSGSAMRQVYPPGEEPQGKSGQLRPWSAK